MSRGCSSIGRAPALQAGGRRFDPVQLHQSLGSFQSSQQFEVCSFSSSLYRLQARQHSSLAIRNGSRVASDESCLFFNNLEGKGAVSLMRARCTRVEMYLYVQITETKGRGLDGANTTVTVASQEDPRLWSQATKCMWWMPWRLQAMKDVAACEKLRGAGKRALIRRCPNGETRPARVTPT